MKRFVFICFWVLSCTLSEAAEQDIGDMHKNIATIVELVQKTSQAYQPAPAIHKLNRQIAKAVQGLRTFTKDVPLDQAAFASLLQDFENKNWAALWRAVTLGCYKSMHGSLPFLSPCCVCGADRIVAPLLNFFTYHGSIKNWSAHMGSPTLPEESSATMGCRGCAKHTNIYIEFCMRAQLFRKVNPPLAVSSTPGEKED